MTRHRDDVARKVKKLVEAIEDGHGGPAVISQLQTREAELQALDAEIKAFAANPHTLHVNRLRCPRFPYRARFPVDR